MGVQDYEDPAYTTLVGAAEDARKVRAVLDSPEHGDYDEVQLLADSNKLSINRPTRAAVLEAIHSLCVATSAEDVLVIYFAGHGGVVANGAYLALADTRRKLLDSTGIALADLKNMLAECRARAVVCLVDACHGDATRDGDAEFSLGELASEACGIAVLGACSIEEKASEMPDGSGVFTHYLLEGLKGAADAKRTGRISATSLFAYVSEQVALWGERENCQQTPTIDLASAGDIVLIGQSVDPTVPDAHGAIESMEMLAYVPLGGADPAAETAKWVAQIRAQLLRRWWPSEQWLLEEGGETTIALPEGHITVASVAEDSLPTSLREREQDPFGDDGPWVLVTAGVTVTDEDVDRPAVSEEMVAAVIGAGIEFRCMDAVCTSLRPLYLDQVVRQVIKEGFDALELRDPPGEVLVTRDRWFEWPVGLSVSADETRWSCRVALPWDWEEMPPKAPRLAADVCERILSASREAVLD